MQLFSFWTNVIALVFRGVVQILENLLLEVTETQICEGGSNYLASYLGHIEDKYLKDPHDPATLVRILEIEFFLQLPQWAYCRCRNLEPPWWEPRAIKGSLSLSLE